MPARPAVGRAGRAAPASFAESEPIVNVDRFLAALSASSLLCFVATLHPITAAVVTQVVASVTAERFVLDVAVALTAAWLVQPASCGSCSGR